ncbi:hypothetical protein P175DRAFT_0556948 [Aspergillus ochraceoroseus IBT 24754]|uniref:CBM-cenC domain-containing protein n=2 Tax=Aspergillus ochraceoroseus TaxID=138278 RepID=A0A2T5M0E6_9EURO|nr:uncharacterized protein P175DRAFT_0556948 [Aspergillus ochraceoroseus IBT 24754]KKK13641.1 hypothetical protein AOCH_003259 [Aspergillus ochraceoroseus]PTU21996.1 hypothetical protein P175DRAFT_0556948 [Aspergillus ochraceoroseus IBT 24754]
MSCNLVANPSFETGSLAPWAASAANVATILSGSTAYSGDYYLQLQTAVGNRGNTISQRLTHLDRSKNYTVTVEAQVAAYSATYCFVSLYMGHNSTTGLIASDVIDATGEWTEVRGYYVPEHASEVLHIVASCDLEDPSYVGNVLLDDVIFSDC